nr:hypothetical protein [Tanacetum cinerariifolium]
MEVVVVVSDVEMEVVAVVVSCAEMVVLVVSDSHRRGGDGSSTPPRYSPGASTPQSYFPGTSKNAECSNCKHLLGKITVLEVIVEMYMHPEQHTLNSAALLHEVYNDMEKLGLE